MPFIQRDVTGRVLAVFANQPRDLEVESVGKDNPDLVAFTAAFALRDQANGALRASDDVVSMCAEHGDALPDDWRSYRIALRAILAGTSDGPLPAAPPLPSFS